MQCKESGNCDNVNSAAEGEGNKSRGKGWLWGSWLKVHTKLPSSKQKKRRRQLLSAHAPPLLPISSLGPKTKPKTAARAGSQNGNGLSMGIACGGGKQSEGWRRESRYAALGNLMRKSCCKRRVLQMADRNMRRVEWAHKSLLFHHHNSLVS